MCYAIELRKKYKQFNTRHFDVRRNLSKFSNIKLV